MKQNYLIGHSYPEPRPVSRRAIELAKRLELCIDAALCVVIGAVLAGALVQWWSA